MVRRIRFIYGKSYSKFGNGPMNLWKVLEGSRKTGRVRNIMEGYRSVRDDPGCLSKSGGFHNRCIHIFIKG